MVEGTVELSEDLEAMLPLSIAIGDRYMGDELGEEFGRRNAVEGELLVRLRPNKIVAHGRPGRRMNQPGTPARARCWSRHWPHSGPE